MLERRKHPRILAILEELPIIEEKLNYVSCTFENVNFLKEEFRKFYFKVNWKPRFRGILRKTCVEQSKMWKVYKLYF